ncbi:hypothetical protein, partial [Vibrio splendidus]|uniref:hypothetical protein n=1 Tax=Vibrio splendidus TaxID=29497 RepID=UPI001A7E1010
RATRSELLGLTYSRCFQSLLVSTSDLAITTEFNVMLRSRKAPHQYMPSLNGMYVNHLQLSK